MNVSVFNCGTHKIPFYHAPVPEITSLANGKSLQNPCNHVTIKLRIFVGDSEHSEDTGDQCADSTSDEEPVDNEVNMI